ncbi:PC-esterase domain-containing protein 1A [Trichonephila clavipes]|nr:PC-esterase domain-containing protein 1A [Trichonephila clavipes]
MFLAGHPSQGCFGLQSHCTPCYFFNQASFYPSDFSFKYEGYNFDKLKLLIDNGISDLITAININIRALYKDFLCLLHQTQFISKCILRKKMEDTVFGDKLVFHGPQSNGRNYREEREATYETTKVSFFFLTRVFDDYVKSVIKKITHKSDPDVIIINCCLWDITR